MDPAPILDPRVLALLERATSALVRAGVQHAVGGALAMAAHGYARQTADVDVFVRDGCQGEALGALRAAGLLVDAIFPPDHYAAWNLADGDPRIRVDLLFPVGGPESSAVESPVSSALGAVTFNAFPAVLLAISKFLANRPDEAGVSKDRADVAAMLRLGLFDAAAAADILGEIAEEERPAFVEFAVSVRAPRPRTPCRSGRRRFSPPRGVKPED